MKSSMQTDAEKWLAALRKCERGSMPTENTVEELKLLAVRAEEKSQNAARRKENRRQRKEAERDWLIRRVKAGLL